MISEKDIRLQFPILSRKINGFDLVYFDNAATTQKPLTVIDRVSEFWKQSNSNIHRGVHTLSREATSLYESARKTVADHFHVSNEQQIVFTAGATDGLNMVAQSLAGKFLSKGDEVIISTYEHHSNILPWQLWAQQYGGTLKVIPLKVSHELDSFESFVSDRTKLIAISHVSNTLGLVTDIQPIIDFARKRNIIVVVDGAQAAPHMQIDLGRMKPDFYACSGHKMYGPSGTGVLYMDNHWLEDLPQSRTGGGTIKSVSFEQTEYAGGALRFEPGTPHIEGAIGLAAAIDFMNGIGLDELVKHEHTLTQYAQSRLKELPEVELYGEHKKKAAVISFNVRNQHPFDVGTLLDKYGIAVRTGHHCTQPLMHCLKVQGTVRISFAVYNTRAEIDLFIEKLKKTISMLS